MSIAANQMTPTTPAGIPAAEHAAILKVLAYFDIFQYPLTKSEIRRYMGGPGYESCFESALQQLTAGQTIFFHNGFYSLHDNLLLSHRRREGNLRAEKLMPRAIKIGRFLYRFPFVRAVCISGSLSKHFADEQADIDFFIITKANRLWIARTIMHLFKKLTFLTGHQHYFCMNYYIDEEALLIGDQNIYTALEIATLIPVAGKPTIDQFFDVNNWAARFFPACNNENLRHEKPAYQPWKKMAEGIFDNHAGNRLDQWLMTITTRRWLKKWLRGKRNKNGHTMQLLTGRHFSRSNPGSFQEKVLSLYEQKLAELRITTR